MLPIQSVRIVIEIENCDRCLRGFRLPLKGQQTLLSGAVRKALMLPEGQNREHEEGFLPSDHTRAVILHTHTSFIIYPPAIHLTDCPV